LGTGVTNLAGRYGGVNALTVSGNNLYVGGEFITLYYLDFSGADGGGRTHTSLRIPDFESSASANSATSAHRKVVTCGACIRTLHRIAIVTSATQNKLTQAQSLRWYTYTKVLDHRKHPIRGLWKARITVEDGIQQQEESIVRVVF
jgi:hypothetical protein